MKVQTVKRMHRIHEWAIINMKYCLICILLFHSLVDDSDRISISTFQNTDRSKY